MSSFQFVTQRLHSEVNWVRRTRAAYEDAQFRGVSVMSLVDLIYGVSDPKLLSQLSLLLILLTAFILCVCIHYDRNRVCNCAKLAYTVIGSLLVGSRLVVTLQDPETSEVKK